MPPLPRGLRPDHARRPLPQRVRPARHLDGGREKAPAAICRKVAEAKLSGRHEIEIWGDGEQTRSFMYIDDCVEGTRRSWTATIDEPINLGSSELVTINQLVDIVEEIAGIKVKRRYDLDAPQGRARPQQRQHADPRAARLGAEHRRCGTGLEQHLSLDLRPGLSARTRRLTPTTIATRAGENALDAHAPLKIQLWSYNYDPEPTGIGIVSTVWARGLRDRGHQVEVVAAHPHYPEPRWGTRVMPYREVRDGIPVLRLPLWIGRASAAERYRQELTFLAAQSAATPFLSRPDVLVSASPSFPALLPAVVNARARKIPWVLWLHDLLPDGATATGLVDEGGTVINLARRLERAAYSAADRIVVLSRAFTNNLLGKGVPRDKVELIYDPATRTPRTLAAPGAGGGPLRILSMGNIGHSQGLTSLVQAFERHQEIDARLIITGTGVAADEARAEIRTSRVEMLGMVDDARLELELQQADIAFVSQRYDGSEFNIPSKLMNFMAYRLPVLAAVNPAGEVARIVEESRGGWIIDSSDPDAFPRNVAGLLRARDELAARAGDARAFAEARFTQEGFAARFEQTLTAAARGRPTVGRVWTEPLSDGEPVAARAYAARRAGA